MPSFNTLIVEKIESGNKLEEQGLYNEALGVYFSVMKEIDGLSSSRYEVEETRWLIRCIYGVYFSQGKYQEAKKWAEDIFKCEIPERATSELIDLGAVYFELGEMGEAYKYFLKAYEKGKHRAFKEYDPKYWAFFKSKDK